MTQDDGSIAIAPAMRERKTPSALGRQSILSGTEQIELKLWTSGFAPLGQILSPRACGELRTFYRDDRRFRSTIDMERYRFGKGQYRYFAYPLPNVVSRLREEFYAVLAPIARRWMEALGLPLNYPPDLQAFLALCHANAQDRPTPLLLRYRAGDFNCLHQDVYGPVVFPFQVIVSLSAPGVEYSGGELLLVEQRPRAQSIGHSLSLARGEAVVITTRYRPVRSARGFYRTNFRHGVSTVIRGERCTLGVIFHDAE
jgi:uncharacterized protein